MAGVNKFLQFAADSTNIINDTDYADSSVRTNGVTSGLAKSDLHNKMYLQWSTIAYIVGQLIADAGYNAEDSNAAVLLQNFKNSIGSAVGGKIFIAEYGTTPYADVDAAISAGKIAFVHDIPAAGEETLYVYEYSDNSNVYFSSVYSTSNTSGSFGWLRVNASNAWTKGSADAMIKGVDYVTAGQLSGSTLGQYATAEGYDTTSSGHGSHAEGARSIASDVAAHAEGIDTTASNSGAHAEGWYTRATGSEAHAEGAYTLASGSFSHAQGYLTTAKNKSQHVFGEYNVPDPSGNAVSARGDYVEIAGNGTGPLARSNARTLDWDGNETIAGRLTMGADPSDDMDAVPKKWLDSAFVTEEATPGDIVTISDGASNVPVKSFVGSIIPVQDLHGQSAPYPAGGGKNKLPMVLSAIKAANTSGTWNGNAYTRSGVTFTVQTDSDGNVTGIATSGTATATFTFMLASSPSLPAGSYVLNGCTGGAISTYCIAVYTNSSTIGYRGTNGDAAISLGSDTTFYGITIYVANGTNMGSKTFYPMIRLASVTDATFAPYSNICPISGWTGANITRAGVNVWDEQWEVGDYDSATGEKIARNNTIRCKNRIPVLPSTKYYAVIPAGSAPLFFYDEDGNYITPAASAVSGEFTTPANAHYMAFRLGTNYGTTYSNNVSINCPSTVTTYQPYNGSTIVLSFGDTVYAGTLTALGGGKWSIQPTTGIVDLGTRTWAYNSTYGFFENEFSSLANGSVADGYLWCESYQPVDGVANAQMPSKPDMSICHVNKYIKVKDSRYTDGTAFKSAVNGVMLCYPLADASLPDPITITGEDLQTLLGANSIWQSCGSVTEMEYRADTKLYIDKRITALFAALSQ